MSVSTNGQICYGFLFEEGYEFPWDDEEFGEDEEAWWRKVKGFKPTKYPYNEEGKSNATEEEKETYWKELGDWQEKNPLPFKMVNVCFEDSPIYILAVTDSLLVASRGFPKEFLPNKMGYNPYKLDILVKFLGEFKIIPEKSAAWYLSSYWG